MTKTINLNHGLVALVDDDDYGLVSQCKWVTLKSPSGHYAVRRIGLGYQFMHRLILKPKAGEIVDHKNGNTLDNRRSNIRLCSHAENMRNRRKHKSNSSGFKGVRWESDRNTWRAEIRINKKSIYLGRFFDKVQAALAYDDAAKKYHGDFARLNFSD